MNISKGTECLECPYGATCEHGNVKAKENFWGMNISSSFPKMQFFPCPLGYCDSPSDSSDYVYNACHGNRSGVLCGKCSDGYSETLYSPLCRKKEKCNDHWFWLATTIYVVFLALYLSSSLPFSQSCTGIVCGLREEQRDLMYSNCDLITIKTTILDT